MSESEEQRKLYGYFCMICCSVCVLLIFIYHADLIETFHFVFAQIYTLLLFITSLILYYKNKK